MEKEIYIILNQVKVMQENAHILLFMPWTVPFSWRGTSRDTGSKYDKPNVTIYFLPQQSWCCGKKPTPMKKRIKIKPLVLKSTFYKIVFKMYKSKT